MLAPMEQELNREYFRQHVKELKINCITMDIG